MRVKRFILRCLEMIYTSVNSTTLQTIAYFVIIASIVMFFIALQRIGLVPLLDPMVVLIGGSVITVICVWLWVVLWR